MRMQFGRPIASFQSMKHKQADMLLDVELAKSAAYFAAAALDEGDADVLATASLAKAAASDAYLQTADPRDPDPWRHRLHLGQRHPSLVQARQGLRGAVRRRPHHREQMMQHMGRLTRGGARDERTHRRLRARRSARLARSQLAPRLRPVEWRNKLVDSGWGAPHWPKALVRPRPAGGLVPVVDEEFARIGAVGVAKAGIRVLAAATILAHGTDLQKEKYLRRILTGEDTWCQLFSEPGSGSDVAGAVTRAEIQGQPLGRQRPEGLDLRRAEGRLGPAAGPHRLGQDQARACPTSSSTCTSPA
jgi:alkylation response protein AidB-like acyl-CoA dehydrogenase